MSEEVINLNETELVEIQSQIKEIVKNIKLVGEHISNASKLYVQLLDRYNPKMIKDEFKKFHISIQALNYLERIGRGQSIPQLFLTPLQNCRLSLSDQKYIIDNTVEHAVLKTDGTLDHQRVNLLEAEPKVIKQIIRNGKILSIAEQKQMLLADSNKRLADEEIGGQHTPWRIVGKKLIVPEKAEFSRRELKLIIEQLE